MKHDANFKGHGLFILPLPRAFAADLNDHWTVARGCKTQECRNFEEKILALSSSWFTVLWLKYAK